MAKSLKKGRLVYLPKHGKYARVLSVAKNKTTVKTIPDGEIIEVVNSILVIIGFLKELWLIFKGLFSKKRA